MTLELFNIGSTVYCVDLGCDEIGSEVCDKMRENGTFCDTCPRAYREVVKRKVLGIEIDARGVFYQTDMQGIYADSLAYATRAEAQAEADRLNKL